MTPQMYEKLLEHFSFDSMDFDYAIFTARLAYTDCRIRVHPDSVNIVIEVGDTVVYRGLFEFAPELSPYNLLLIYHKTNSKSIDKMTDLGKIHIKIIKSYKINGYNFKSFIKADVKDINSFTQRLSVVSYKDYIVSYKIITYTHGHNGKMTSTLTEETFCYSNNILSKKTKEFYCGVADTCDVSELPEHEAYSRILEASNDLSSDIMQNINPYFRKYTIADIISDIENVP